MDSSYTKRTAPEGLGGSDQEGSARIGNLGSKSANACRKHNIPLPSAGHWTKVELGHKIAPKPLSPELSGNETVQIHIRERLSPELAAVAAEHSPQVPELSHALALRTEKLLASGKENERKLLVPKTGAAAHLLVSRQQGFMAEERGRTPDRHGRR